MSNDWGAGRADDFDFPHQFSNAMNNLSVIKRGRMNEKRAIKVVLEKSFVIKNANWMMKTRRDKSFYSKLDDYPKKNWKLTPRVNDGGLGFLDCDTQKWSVSLKKSSQTWRLNRCRQFLVGGRRWVLTLEMLQFLYKISSYQEWGQCLS